MGRKRRLEAIQKIHARISKVLNDNGISCYRHWENTKSNPIFRAVKVKSGNDERNELSRLLYKNENNNKITLLQQKKIIEPQKIKAKKELEFQEMERIKLKNKQRNLEKMEALKRKRKR